MDKIKPLRLYIACMIYKLFDTTYKRLKHPPNKTINGRWKGRTEAQKGQ